MGSLQNFLRFASFPSSHVKLAGTSFSPNSPLKSSGHGHDGLHIVGQFSYTAGMVHLCAIIVSFRAAHSHDFSVPGLISNLSVLLSVQSTMVGLGVELGTKEMEGATEGVWNDSGHTLHF